MVKNLSPPIAADARLPATQAADRAETLRELNSYLASAVCHLVALVLLGLLAAAVKPSDAGIQLQLQLGDGNDIFAGEEGASAGAEDLGDVAAEALASVVPQQLFDFEAVAPTESELAEVPLESLAAAEKPFDDKDVVKQIDQRLAKTIGLGGSGLGESGSGSGEWTGRGSLSGAEKGFFGIGDSGKTFVYVVDASDSMNERGKFQRARYELTRSLEQLSPDQRYFVIFYNDGAYPMDAEEPLDASQEHVAQTCEWVNDVQPTGGTNPLPALLLALTLKPDAVYFLSDGQFDPQTLPELRARNRDSRRLDLKRVPIHTIAFGDRLAEPLMKSISRYSGGRYRFVR